MSKTVIGNDAGMEAIMAGENVFITGPGGSGKSMMISSLREFFGESFLFVAPTGIAALNIAGMSCHKAFGLTFGITTDEDFKAKSRKAAMLLSSDALEALVIDEISMVRRDKLKEMDMKLRYHRKVNKPFGGLQVIAFGDGFQIKPVLVRNEMAEFRRLYGDEIPFESDVWNSLNFTNCYLPKVHRQADPVYANHLNNIRVGKNLNEAVEFLNKNCCFGKAPLPDAVTLTTTNKMAEAINAREFAKIKADSHDFHAQISGEFPDRPVQETLSLKVGLKVMITVNHNPKEGEGEPQYVNGTVGIVSRIARTFVVVNVDGVAVTLGKNEWKNNIQVPETYWKEVEEEVDMPDGTKKTVKKKVEATRLVDKEIGKFLQFPLKLGYAITGHKSQGLTLDKVNIDLGYGAFTAGQTYVMLSRARSVEGLRLSKPLRVKDIIVDQQVADFYKRTFPQIFGGDA
ncbi:Ti-type conjugative transfer relaxase [Salmonella phage SSBI34]|nr:Ti-type conjugative transfer relaxase [Salmonella phage SSBI34]